jgi:hypothetical protein
LDATPSCTAAPKVTDHDVTGADWRQLWKNWQAFGFPDKIFERRVSIRRVDIELAEFL